MGPVLRIPDPADDPRLRHPGTAQEDRRLAAADTRDEWEDRRAGGPRDPRSQRAAGGARRASRPAARSRITTTRASARCTSRSPSTTAPRSPRPRSRRTRSGTRSSTSGLQHVPAAVGDVPGVSLASNTWIFLLMGGAFSGRRADPGRHRPLRRRGALPARDAAGRVRRVEAGARAAQDLGLVTPGERRAPRRCSTPPR